jgi:hypothetical protein
LEILIACAEKDLHFAADALAGALASTLNPVARVSLVVPDSIVKQSETVVAMCRSPNVQVGVIPETELVSSESIAALRDAFGSRFGWALQQMLRNRFITRHSRYPTLVVDADTVLCFARTWIDNEGRQVMTPTWEFNEPYYLFLQRQIGTSVKPRHTFIPHHMLIQPGIFVEANRRAGTETDEELLAVVLAQARNPHPSSFCLIYEVYAQWLIQEYPEQVHLERWSNRFVRRSHQRDRSAAEIVEEAKALGYCSVSLHSWS